VDQSPPQEEIIEEEVEIEVAEEIDPETEAPEIEITEEIDLETETIKKTEMAEETKEETDPDLQVKEEPREMKERTETDLPLNPSLPPDPDPTRDLKQEMAPEINPDPEITLKLFEDFKKKEDFDLG
jgi:hypothetical protein